MKTKHRQEHETKTCIMHKRNENQLGTNVGNTSGNGRRKRKTKLDKTPVG
jgi:hypothetical protein